MNEVLVIVLVIIFGLMFGRISFFGIKFGAAGVLLVGLVFGHFGYDISKIITDIGLLLFIAGVGISAGPVFIQNFKSKAVPYIVISISTIAFASVLAFGIFKLLELPLPLTIGVMTGALTSTPGLGAAIEATGSQLASVGYGIAYPFGVVGVILFVQLAFPIFKKQPQVEREIFLEGLAESQAKSPRKVKKYSFRVDKEGFFPYFLAVLLGVLIGMINVPLPGGSEIGLGNAGGALVAGLIIGHIGGIGPVSLEVDEEIAGLLSDFGLILFYAGTGVSAGHGALLVLMEYGLALFLGGAAVTVFSSVFAFIIGRFIFRLGMVDSLGAVTGAMTATPGLGALIDTSGTPKAAASYASTYPLALLSVVIFSQILALLG